VSVSQAGSALEIVAGADGSVITIVENNHNVFVEDNGVQIYNSGATLINSIKVTGQAKMDQIFYTGNTVGANIRGNGGNDALTVRDSGSAGSYVSGDGGDDSLVVLDANNTTVVGDGGGDLLIVSDAVSITRDVHIYGMGGSDFISIAGGRNFVYGGGGNDTLVTNGVNGVDFVLMVVDGVESVAAV
jgi:hypothetical protein